MTIQETILYYGVIFINSLASTFVFSVWLPRQSYEWKNKLLYAILISSTVLVISLLVCTSIVMDILSDPLWLVFALFLLLLFSPHVVCANALLYYGGKTIRIHLSKGRVVFGYVRVVLGFLLMYLPLALILGIMEVSTAFGN